ncbi:mRNA-capping enzyme [Anaeramoeba flamelloides]|uniref:mRNA guanylyltransferase n=1 Tax=Anaeramoeba flamelloides TaxID=1746091 RepID=A0ABQ8YYJ4_9EUKA|nr:mRNA-capping enzyme [Anaeramoeba flamelloides]
MNTNPREVKELKTQTVNSQINDEITNTRKQNSQLNNNTQTEITNSLKNNVTQSNKCGKGLDRKRQFEELTDLNPKQGNQKRKTKHGCKIPRGWELTPRSGDLIKGTPILPIKTPVEENFFPQNQKFTPNMVVLFSGILSLRVGLIIDLTNQYGYYSRDYFQERGITHLKLPCSGHREEVPPRATIHHFICKIVKYVRSNPSKLIAVHCTHGYNRTGFMICCFLVEVMKLDLSEALNRFANSRPPGIYKQYYIDALAKRYEVDPKMISFSIKKHLPIWKKVPKIPNYKKQNLKSLDNSNRNNNNSSNNNNKNNTDNDQKDEIKNNKKKKVKKSIFERLGIKVNENEQQQLRQYVSQRFGKNSEFPGMRPIRLQKDNLKYLKKQDYFVTYKADSVRCMLLITNPYCYLIDSNYTFYHVQVHFPGLKLTLLDGEIVCDELFPKNQSINENNNENSNRNTNNNNEIKKTEKTEDINKNNNNTESTKATDNGRPMAKKEIENLDKENENKNEKIKEEKDKGKNNEKVNENENKIENENENKNEKIKEEEDKVKNNGKGNEKEKENAQNENKQNENVNKNENEREKDENENLREILNKHNQKFLRSKWKNCENDRVKYYFQVYDLMFYNRAPYWGKDLSQRLGMAHHLISERKKMSKTDQKSEPFGIRFKDMYALKHTKKILESFIQSLNHFVEGLVFTSLPQSYSSELVGNVLKWKPIYLNTVVFMLRDHSGTENLTVGLFLLKDEQEKQVAEISFENLKSKYKYLNRFVECQYNLLSKKWKIIRSRKGKNHPQNYETFLKIQKSIDHYVSNSELVSFIEDILQNRK